MNAFNLMYQALTAAIEEMENCHRAAKNVAAKAKLQRRIDQAKAALRAADSEGGDNVG